MLKSRILAEALNELLMKEYAGDKRIFTGDCRNGAHDFIPDILIVAHNSVSQESLSAVQEAKGILLDTGLQMDKVISLLLMYKIHGVIHRDADTALFIKALKLVYEGQIWMDNNILKLLLSKTSAFRTNEKIERISKREQEILDLIIQGKKNKDIAEGLFMSEQTVKAHIGHIFRKFNVSSRTQLVSLLLNNSP
jgi:DNA-binding NarL/FixJ family response regulator